jgi:hypothetical protein
MPLILSILNSFCLLIGIFWMVTKKLSELSVVLSSFISLVLLMLLLSYCYFLSLVFHGHFYVLLGLLSLINGAHCYWSIPWFLRIVRGSADIKHEGVIAQGWIVLAIGVAVSTFFFGRYVERWGSWDAWAIWNLHAKFLYYPDSWTQLFSRAIAYTHPDYPLMLPSLIAFGWKSVGAIGPIVPAVIAYIPIVLIPGVIFFSLFEKGLKGYGYLSLVLIVSNMSFIGIASGQLADSLLALVMLICFILYQRLRETSSALPYLIGFMAASATWIKNEGAMFYLFFALLFPLSYRKRPLSIVQFAIGSLFPLLVFALFKWGYASSNYLFDARKGSDIVAQVADPARYWMIVKSLFGAFLSDFGPLVVVVVLAFILGPHFPSFGGWVLLLLLVCYAFVYVITPFDLRWHMATSQDRLLHQLYPSCLYLSLNHLRNFSWKNLDALSKSS